MKIPCEECIVLAVCRHKRYYRLVQCDLISVYLTRYSLHMEKKGYQTRLMRVEQILKPPGWGVDYYGGLLLRYKGVNNENSM